MDRVIDQHLKYIYHIRLAIKLDRVEIFPVDSETGEFHQITDRSPVISSLGDLIANRQLVDRAVTNFFFMWSDWACTTVIAPEAIEAVRSPDPSAIENVKEHYWFYMSFDKWEDISDSKDSTCSDLASFKVILENLAKSKTFEEDLVICADDCRPLDPEETDKVDENDPDNRVVDIKDIISIYPEAVAISRADVLDDVGASALASEFVSINCKEKKRKLLDLLAQESGLDHYEFDRQSKRSKKE